MPAKSPSVQSGGEEQPEREGLADRIRKSVMDTLGRPGSLFMVQVRSVWEDHYRVNVLVGPDSSSAKVAHSYFLVAGRDGSIVASTPEITRQY